MAGKRRTSCHQKDKNSKKLWKQHQPLHQDKTTKLKETLNHFMQVSFTYQKNIDASIKTLEVQMDQFAKELVDLKNGAFSDNTQTNPKEQCRKKEL